MKKRMGSSTFINSVKDTFPYIESAIVVLDNNLSWWKKNYESLEETIANEASGLAENPTEIKVRFTVYSGPDENVESVTWNGPAIELTFIEKSDKFVRDLKNRLGTSWEGHRLITDENKLIILFE